MKHIKFKITKLITAYFMRTGQKRNSTTERNMLVEVCNMNHCEKLTDTS